MNSTPRRTDQPRSHCCESVLSDRPKHDRRSDLDEQPSVLHRLSTILAQHRDLRQVLDTAARSAAQVMAVKSVCIRMLDDSGGLAIGAVFNLSPSYAQRPPLPLHATPILRESLGGRMVFVKDLRNDPRVVYPGDADREGVVSMICTPMIYQDHPVGVIQLFTAEPRRFDPAQMKLMQAVAQLLTTAIETARLDNEHRANQQMQRQLQLAAEVQKRMLPAATPHAPPFDIAARYVPNLELGGDFYDFIDLDGNLGIGIADVAGKGVAASLLMASVRSSLRAYAQDIYEIDEVVSRVNAQLTSDTLDNEFATLFYGVLDRQSLRLTYCNAGHEPGLLLRGDQIISLEAGGIIIGMDAEHHYEKDLVQLMPGDRMLLYTDGLADAFDYDQQRYGRQRIWESLRVAPRDSARTALNHIIWCMRCFCGLKQPTDDTTLVVIDVEPWD